MPKRLPRFKVVVADADLFFAFNRNLKERELIAMFERRIEPLQSEVFPGLILKDDDGDLLKPKLQVILVPAEEKP